ncbi:MAG: hypothetical protein CFH01_01886 [Alphaproteobacteria bacterium MarineAlpha2_Bin1]|nr:MAG: hypothetical protein CFH01_01886 [Alphaproteobacteria bacterium MarineAlpha2_Bin1]|tara:strand:+ start:237 stop:914 length:678 start_codon:yes stop_codon:yes gene_type:complete
MNFLVYQGQINILETGGQIYDYENFIVTCNPDGSRTLRTVSRSPKKDLLRDVYQRESEDWEPKEAFGSLYYKGKYQGSIHRRLIDNNLHSWLWSANGKCDYQVFPIDKNVIIGFHAIFHEAWKMKKVINRNNEYNKILTHTVSDTWNGKTISHGSMLLSKARYEGIETVYVSAGNFLCEKFIWLTPFGKELLIWSHGDDSIFVKMEVIRGNNKGVIYELANFKKF